MGMESFNIMALADEVYIIRKNQYRYINGTSNIHYKNFKLELDQLSNITRDDFKWVLDNCIEILGYHSNGFFQGIELRGCFAYLDESIDLCFKLIDIISKKIVPLKIYILNQEVKAENSKQLREFIRNMYNDKITIFQKQYGHVQFKVTCGEFYKEIKKRNKWYYKILHSNK